MKKSVAILFLILCVFSCDNKDDASPIAVILESGKIAQLAESNTKIPYEIECFSLHSTINRLTISSFDSEKGEKMLFDSVPNSSKFNYSFIYEVPEFSKDSVEITLKMKVTDLDNNFYELKCFLTVTGSASLLPELSGIVMYSGASEKPDAFSLKDPSLVFLKALADSASVDVYDYVDQNNQNTLSREWRTNTDVKFVRINSFNYSAATSLTIKNAYTSSVRQNFINNISLNDIILVGRNEAEGVLQVVGLEDQEGNLNDFYRFNFKVIKKGN